MKQNARNKNMNKNAHNLSDVIKNCDFVSALLLLIKLFELLLFKLLLFILFIFEWIITLVLLLLLFKWMRGSFDYNYKQDIFSNN